MKRLPILILAALTLQSCANFNPQQAIATAGGLASIIVNAYQQYNDAKGGKSTPTQVITQAQNDAYGVAALLQAYVGTGKTVGQVNAASGASNPVAAQTVLAGLPDAPVTQSTVTLVQTAAQLVGK